MTLSLTLTNHNGQLLTIVWSVFVKKIKIMYATPVLPDRPPYLYIYWILNYWLPVCIVGDFI